MASILRISLYTAILTLVACQSKKSITSQETAINTGVAIDYPEAMDKIFAHHGGLDLWKKQ